MKFIKTVILLLFAISIHSQIILNWEKEDTPGMNKVYVIVESNIQFSTAGFSFQLEYNNKEAKDNNLINYLIGLKSSISPSFPFQKFRYINYFGPHIGLLFGRKRHLIETKIGYGYMSQKNKFDKPSTFEWIPSFSIGYRKHEKFTIYTFGLGYPQVIHIGIGHQLY